MPVPHTHRPPSFLLNSNQKRDRISQPGIFPLVCIVPTIYIPSLPLSTPISLLTTSLSPPTVHPCVSRLSPSPPSPPSAADVRLFSPLSSPPLCPVPLPRRCSRHGHCFAISAYSASPGYAKQRANNGPQTRSPTVSSSSVLQFLSLSFSFFLSFFPPSSSLSVSLLASTY